MRLRFITAALLAGLGLAACGSSNSDDTVANSGVATAPVTVTAPPAITTAITTATATPTTTTVVIPPTATTTAATTAAPAEPETVTTATITQPDSGGADSGGAGLGTDTTAASTCVAADLTPAALPPNSAPGTTVLGFTLTNTSSSACHTYGWPGIAFVDSAGTAVSTLTTRSTHDVLGSTPPTAFSIAAGAQASFRVTVHDAGGGTQANCSEYSKLQIIAPNDTATMVVTIPDGPVQTCGNVAVSAVEPGASATGQ